MRLVILDRDGVINEDSDYYIKSADEWRPIPGSIQAVARLTCAGFTVAVATNQSGIGRGLFDLNALDEMHHKLTTLVNAAGGEIAKIAYCPHHPDDRCDCRKPATGLVKQIEKELLISAKHAWLVGDSLKDIQLAQSCECKPVLVLTGKGKKTFLQLKENKSLQETLVFPDLAAFANAIT
ncbi:MAG: D-glycero-beta-D-manno-heptose 1,7-bisphosphate 7-phosphatase [Endozoicomonadaceae bacterium]|nr:D-glycero-beta-D-manno-heptose 1,7-bisphosphate 7-phosphatase [Endozoicomonadaceae bacterium]MCY4329952.1 D-glycero-beta-D-manno-heptose 1,7-bisphosphate 7-phosphatase [Endozoicomonadaceae bacterium]